MRMWVKTIVAIILVSLTYWRLELVFGLAYNGRVGGVLQCILIIVCTAILLNKIESLKSKDREQESKQDD